MDGGHPLQLEKYDKLETYDTGDDSEIDVVREGAASFQDLLLVIKKAELK